MWNLIWLVPLSAFALLTCIVMGGPRRYGIVATVLALLLLWGWARLGMWGGLGWLLLYGGLRTGLQVDYARRRQGTERGVRGHSRYISFLSQGDKRQPLVIWLAPLKVPLYWVARRVKGPLPGMPPMPGMGKVSAGQVLMPMLNQVFGESRGFRIDTRHLRSQQGPAMEIRCD